MTPPNLPTHAAFFGAWLLDKALTGLPPLLSAEALVHTYRQNIRHPHDEARLAALVRHEAAKNFTAAFISSLGGVLTLPVALPAGLGATWLLQTRLAAAIASLRGHRLDEPWVRASILLSLTGAASPDILRQAGVRAGEWAARRMAMRLSDDAVRRINQRVGFSLLAQAGSRGTLNLSRLVPVAGAAVGGAFDVYGCYAVAKTAKRLFIPPRLLGPTGETNADDPDAPY